jgi:hypothetical protein
MAAAKPISLMIFHKIVANAPSKISV